MRLVEEWQQEALFSLDVGAQQRLEPEQVASDRRVIAADVPGLQHMGVVVGDAVNHFPNLLMLEMEEARRPWRPCALVQLGIQPRLLPCRVRAEHTFHPCKDVTELPDEFGVGMLPTEQATSWIWLSPGTSSRCSCSTKARSDVHSLLPTVMAVIRSLLPPL